MRRKLSGDLDLHRSMLERQKLDLSKWIFIPFNVPSSKNNRVFTGSSFIENKRCQKYRKDTKKYWLEKKVLFEKMKQGKSKPYYIMFYYVRGTHHKFDYCNMLQLPQDLMTEHEWLVDDNCNEIIPIILPYAYSKDNPGVYIKIL